MNKWSLLLFSVLGLLLSTTSELNFVDGRVGCCDRSSRPLLSDTRLSIYEPHCNYHTFTEINQLISPKRDIRYATKNIELKRSSRSDGRRGQFEDRRIASDERFRVLRNDVFDLEDSTSSNARGRKSLREINDLQLRRNLKSFSRNNFGENHVDQSRTRNNDFLRDKMERNSLERRINAEEEFSEIRVNRFRQNDGPVTANLKERKQEGIHRRAFVIRTNIILNPRENIDETRLRFIQKNEGKRNMERSNLDIRQRLFRDTRLTTDLSRNSDHRLKTDDRDSNERHVTMRLDSKIGILRNGNIRNYRHLSVRDDNIEKMYERGSLTDVRRNTDMDGTMNDYRRSYDKDISEEILEGSNSKNVQNERFKRLDIGSSRPRTIQRVSGSGNRIRDDRRQMSNGFEKRLFEERHSTQRIPRQNSNINRLQEIRQARLYNDMILEDAEDYSNVFIERTERAPDQNRNRKIRENNREIRLGEEYTSERSIPRNKNSLAEKRAVSSETIRRSVLERRERENSRYRIEHENKNIFDQRIRPMINSRDEDILRDARNTQRKLIRSNVMGQEINNVRQNYDDENVSQRLLVRDDNNRKLVSRLERERLSLTVKRLPQIRISQRENQSKMHIRAINIQEKSIQEHKNFNRRLVSNTNGNEEIRQSRTYNEKSDREEFRNSWVRDGERAFDERRLRQVRDNHVYMREYRLNVERFSTHNDRNKNNIVERGVVSILSSVGNNRLYGISRSALTVLRRRENDQVRYWSVHENEPLSYQRRTTDVLERREDNLSNERLAQRNLSSRNSMNNAMLNYNNRRSYNDENNSQVIFARTNQREMTNRLDRERFSTVNKRSSYLRMIQREHKNRMHNDYRQLMNIQDNRLRNERYAKIIEKQESAIRPEFVNQQNQNTKRALILLQLREKDVPSLIRLNKRDFEQSRNGILRNRREFTRVDDHSSNIRIAQIRGLRNTNERSNFRDTRNKVITRSYETEFHDSDETHHERRTERVIRNMSINNRVLLEARSENQRDANRELEHIRNVRSDNVPGNSAHRENKDNVRTSNRDNIRRRDAKDRARDIRASNRLQTLKEESRITKTRRTNEEEREIRTAFSKIRYLPIEHKTQSDNQIFEIKLQYMFYLLQGLYILGFFTKFTKNYNGVQKTTRFSNWFPLFSTLKVH